MSTWIAWESRTASTTINISEPGGPAQPAWEVALLLPLQGQWGESDYLWLTDRTKRLVEVTDGYIEVLPMPTEEQRLEGNAYVEHRVATHGSRATSTLLEGFVVDVAETLDAVKAS